MHTCYIISSYLVSFPFLKCHENVSFTLGKKIFKKWIQLILTCFGASHNVYNVHCFEIRICPFCSDFSSWRFCDYPFQVDIFAVYSSTLTILLCCSIGFLYILYCCICTTMLLPPILVLFLFEINVPNGYLSATSVAGKSKEEFLVWVDWRTVWCGPKPVR